MDWHNKFIKIANLIEDIDTKEGRPITREYLVELRKNHPDEYAKFIQVVNGMVKSRLSSGDKTVDSGIRAKMVKEVLSIFLNRSDADVKMQAADHERALLEKAEKTALKPKMDPAIHVDDHREYIDLPPKCHDEIREKHRIPGNIPIATPLVKKPMSEPPSPFGKKPTRIDTKNTTPTAKMDSYVGPDGKRRFRMAGMDENHPANGKLCRCNGKIARVCQCIRDGNGDYCACVRYEDGEFDMALLDW